jgi:hypothetical protein
MVREAAAWPGATSASSATCRARRSASTASRRARCSSPTARIRLDASLAVDAGTDKAVGIAYKKLPTDVHVGDVLLLNDGQISLQVENRRPAHQTRVLVGGELGNNKGINRQGGGLSAGALTDKDREDIRTAAALKVDYLAVSFPRDAADMNEARACCARPAATGCWWRRSSAPRRSQSGGGGAGERRGHGRARRPRRRNGLCRTRRPAEADHSGARHQNKRRHHGDADDGVDDRQHDSDARRGVGRRQCGHGRHRCGDALGRDRLRQASRPRWSRRCRRSSSAPRSTRTRTCASGSATPGTSAHRRGDRGGGDVHGEPPAT